MWLDAGLVQDIGGEIYAWARELWICRVDLIILPTCLGGYKVKTGRLLDSPFSEYHHPHNAFSSKRNSAQRNSFHYKYISSFYV
jgi:hypothetical protein